MFKDGHRTILSCQGYLSLGSFNAPEVELVKIPVWDTLCLKQPFFAHSHILNGVFGCHSGGKSTSKPLPQCPEFLGLFRF